MTARQPDTGESTAAIIARGDAADWPHVVEELKAGATLLLVRRLQRAYLDRGRGPYGRGISAALVRRLEHEGVLRFVGVDRYELVAAP